MGHVNHGGAQILVHLHDFEAHVDAKRGVKIGQRLVKQEAFGIAHDGAADGNALALAAGKLARLAVEIFGEIERGGGLGHFRFDLGLGHAGHFQAEGNVAAHAHVRIERIGLEHHGEAALRRRLPPSCPCHR